MPLVHIQFPPPRRTLRAALPLIAALVLFLTAAGTGFAAQKDKPAPDVIVFTNGDQLSGTFVRAVTGTVTFHSDVLGDVSVPFDKIKELHTAAKVAVMENGAHINRKNSAAVPQGTMSISDQVVTLQSPAGATIPPIPVKNAQYIIDQTTFNKEVLGHPGFLQGWSGAATAGASIVQATQNQSTFNGAIALVRTVPTVSWLDTRNRTTADFTGSYGKITEPTYTINGVTTPASTVKSAIYHAGAERDEYFSPRMYLLANVSFDHNYSQNLDLQQIYGGGIGWTAIKRPKQELDLTATMQYEKQSFFNATPGSNQNLIGSTFGGNYALKLPKGMTFTQQLLYIPAYNNVRAYSVSETDVLALPVYKNFSLSVGTLDTYLNDPPTSEPPTKRNSFQFQTGVTYNIKSAY